MLCSCIQSVYYPFPESKQSLATSSKSIYTIIFNKTFIKLQPSFLWLQTITSEVKVTKHLNFKSIWPQTRSPRRSRSYSHVRTSFKVQWWRTHHQHQWYICLQKQTTSIPKRANIYLWLLHTMLIYLLFQIRNFVFRHCWMFRVHFLMW